MLMGGEVREKEHERTNAVRKVWTGEREKGERQTKSLE